jgi:hypothetical protein
MLRRRCVPNRLKHSLQKRRRHCLLSHQNITYQLLHASANNCQYIECKCSAALFCCRSRAKESQARAMGPKAIIPSGDDAAMKEAAGAGVSVKRWHLVRLGGGITPEQQQARIATSSSGSCRLSGAAYIA